MMKRILSLALLLTTGGLFACDDAISSSEDTAAEKGVLRQGLPKNQGGVPGNETYCVYASPCDPGEGDCDGDNHCVEGAYCLHNHGEAWGYDHLVDMCVADTCLDGVRNGEETGVDCGPGCLPCGPEENGDDAFCTTLSPCSARQGDCDYDGHCLDGLFCAENIGADFGFRSTVDMCLIEACRDGVQNGSETGVDCGGSDCAPCPTENGDDAHCTSLNKCSAGEGDCDYDGHCVAGTYCAYDIGAQFGFRSTVDVCLLDSCNNGVQDGSETDVDCGPGCLPCESHEIVGATRAGGSGDELVGEMKSDTAGGVVIVGSFRGETTIGDRTMQAFGTTGRRDVFVTRQSSTGATLWTRRFGGPLSDGDNDVAVSVNRGRIAVAGNFHGTADFGDGSPGFELSSAGRSDIFVALLNLDGELQWVRRFGGSGWDAAFGVEIDDGANVNVVGGFEDSVQLGATSLSSAGELDGFVMQLSASGAVQNAIRLGGPARDVAFGVDSGSDRSLTVVGAFADTAELGLGAVTSAGARDGFVTRINGSTFVQPWVRSFGGVREDILRSVEVDSANRSYSGGYYMRSVNFGGGVRTSTAVDAVVLALNADGSYRWDYELPESAVQAISVDRSAGRVAVTGFCTNARQNLSGAAQGGEDVFTLLLSSGGSRQAGWRDGGPGNDRGSGVVAGSGVCNVAGHFLDNGSFVDGSLRSAGQRDLFLSRRRY